MKRNINFKRYDTATARRLAGWDNHLPPDYPVYCAETLFCKHTGEFFLHCQGGPASRYAQSLGDGKFQAGESIYPLSAEAAEEWAKAHLDSGAYLAIFGPIQKSDETTLISIRLPVHLLAQIKRQARAAGETQSAFISRLLQSALEQ